MKILSPRQIYIWMLIVSGLLGKDELSAQQRSFPTDFNLNGISAVDIFANVKMHGEDYISVNQTDTINLTKIAKRSDLYKKAAAYLSKNKPVVKHDTIYIEEHDDVTGVLKNGVTGGSFKIDVNDLQGTEIVLNHFLFSVKTNASIQRLDKKLQNPDLQDLDRKMTEVAKKALELDRECVAVLDTSGIKEKSENTFWHEYKHYENRTIIFKNIEYLTPEEIYILDILDEITAHSVASMRLAVKHGKLIKKDINNALDNALGFVSNPKISRYLENSFKSSHANISKRFYKKPDNNVFLQTVDSILTYNFDGKLIHLADYERGISKKVVKKIKEAIPNYSKVVEQLNAIPQNNILQDVYHKQGTESLNENIANWIEIAKSKKQQE